MAQRTRQTRTRAGRRAGEATPTPSSETRRRPAAAGPSRFRPPGSWQRPDQHYLVVLRDPWYRVVAELQDLITVRTIEFWSARGARLFHFPITTGSVSSPTGPGSDSMPVEVELGGGKTYLADSMQFLLEYGCRLAPRGCYYVMPSFRGEPADASHLSQFFHSEAEIIGGLKNVIAVVEEYLRFLASALLADQAPALSSINPDLSHLEKVAAGEPFTRIMFEDAVTVLRDDPRFVEHDPRGWRSINRRGEQRLMQVVGEPLWLTHMDHMAVPFYQGFAEQDGRRAKNGDLLAGIGEMVGCGERHATGIELSRGLELHGIPAERYRWYREMKDRFPLRTAGFGMGLERFLLWVLRHDDIRDIPLLLRFNGRDIDP